MPNSIIAEGKTSTEAIENGLKTLNATKDEVEIKILESEDKRSFFSILAPRTIKVEITKKEKKEEVEHRKKEYEVSTEELETGKKRVEDFLKEFTNIMHLENVQVKVEIKEKMIQVSLLGEDVSFLIGYRGETLNAFQTILSGVANRELKNHCKVLVDVENYRKRREKTLEELAQKVSKTVMKNKKAVTLEPMSAYERKIIHTKLQNHKYVKTYSVGEEPHRKVVITLK